MAFTIGSSRFMRWHKTGRLCNLGYAHVCLPQRTFIESRQHHFEDLTRYKIDKALKPVKYLIQRIKETDEERTKLLREIEERQRILDNESGIAEADVVETFKTMWVAHGQGVYQFGRLSAELNCLFNAAVSMGKELPATLS